MARELLELLESLIEEARDDGENIKSITFEQAGLLTNNLGLVIDYNGEKYQLEMNGTWGD